MRVIENSIIKPLPTEELINKEEQYWNVKIPDDYRNFISKNNGCVPIENTFVFEKYRYVIERFLCILEDTKNHKMGMYDIDVNLTMLDARLITDEDLVGAELVPIAALFGGDFVCLDYYEDRENPQIAIWYNDESEDLHPSTNTIANNFEEFINMLFE